MTETETQACTICDGEQIITKWVDEQTPLPEACPHCKGTGIEPEGE